MIECLGFAALTLAGGAVQGAEGALFIQSDRIIVRPGHEVAGAVLVQEGVIVAVGPGLSAPEGARTIRGEVVCAGFLDSWSSLGMDADSAGDQRTSPSTRALDGLDPWSSDPLLRDSLEAGVTALRVQAGLEADFGGLSAVVSNGTGEALLEDAGLAATVGCSRSGRVPDVFDRIEQVDKLVGQIEAGIAYREAQVEFEKKLAEWQEAIAKSEEELDKDFKKAKKKREEEIAEAEEKDKEFKEKKYKEDKKPEPPRPDPDKEVLARVGMGEIPLVVEVHRAPELRELLAKTEPFGRLRLVLAGASEALPFAEELARRHVPVIVWPAPLPRPRPSELKELDLDLAAELADAGVRVLFGSGGEGAARDLPVLAALAVGHGLERDLALAALTTAPAESFDLAHRLGSVERGKDADLLVLDGDPLDVATRVRFVVRRGAVVVQQ